jgi:predicted aspartyl protease
MCKTLTAFAAAMLAAAFLSVLAVAAPSADEILSANKAVMGGSAWDGKITMSTDGNYSGEGLTGTVHTLTDLKAGRSVGQFTIGPASGANGFDGTDAWVKDPSGTVALQQGGDALVLAVNQAYRDAEKWWRADHGGAKIVNDGEKVDSSGKWDVLTITPKGGKPFDAWFDANTHLLFKTIEQQGPQTVTTTFFDYRRTGDVMQPFKTTIDRGLGAKYLDTITVTKVEFLGVQPDAAYAVPKVVVADFSINGGAPQSQIPIQIINNHIYGAATVNGKGPFTFIFDTGGSNIITPPLAKELGLNVQGQLGGTGAGEGVMEAGLTSGVTLEVGDAVVKNQIFIVTPLETLSDIEGTPMPGMVGYETFRRFVTRIDYGARTLTLIDPKHFDPKDAGTPIKFVFNRSIPEIMGTIEGLPAKFDIDTGSRSELTITKPFAEKNGLRAKHPKGVDAVDGWGVGGPSRGYVTRAADMTIGPIRIDGVVATLATQSKGAFSGNDYSANLGGGILKRFVVTFDYNSQIMYLKPLPGPIADVGVFDRAGMWFNQSGSGFKIVDVTKGAPAQEAGLKAGDIILAVDGTPVTNLHLYDVRQRLRDQPAGTVVTFKIVHGKASKNVRVVLRDLI